MAFHLEIHYYLERHDVLIGCLIPRRDYSAVALSLVMVAVGLYGHRLPGYYINALTVPICRC